MNNNKENKIMKNKTKKKERKKYDKIMINKIIISVENIQFVFDFISFMVFISYDEKQMFLLYVFT